MNILGSISSTEQAMQGVQGAFNSLTGPQGTQPASLAGDVMLSLGGFQFGIETAAYQELRRVVQYKWAALERFTQADALQFVGYGAETIELPGVIYPDYKGGRGQLDTLRGLASMGITQTLIDGQGTVLGDWVIEEVEETQSAFTIAGQARKQGFSVKLRKAQDVVASPLAAPPGLADTSVDPTGSGGLSGLISSAVSSAGSIMNTMQTAAAQVSKYVDTASAIGSSIMGAMNRVTSAGSKLQGACQAASRAVNSVAGSNNIYRTAGGLIVPCAASVAVLHSAMGSLSGDVLKPLRNGMTAADSMTTLMRSTQSAAQALGL